MYAYLYDENFIYDRPVLIQIVEHEDGTIEEIIPPNSTLIVPEGFFRARWNGVEWEEDASEWEMEQLEQTSE